MRYEVFDWYNIIFIAAFAFIYTYIAEKKVNWLISLIPESKWNKGNNRFIYVLEYCCRPVALRILSLFCLAMIYLCGSFNFSQGGVFFTYAIFIIFCLIEAIEHWEFYLKKLCTFGAIDIMKSIVIALLVTIIKLVVRLHITNDSIINTLVAVLCGYYFITRIAPFLFFSIIKAISKGLGKFVRLLKSEPNAFKYSIKYALMTLITILMVSLTEQIPFWASVIYRIIIDLFRSYILYLSNC